MTPDEWHRIKKVLETALDLEPYSRGQFLDSACGGDGAIRREVESLVESHDEDAGFLEHPVVIDAAHLAARPLPETWVGRQLGSYELLEEVGAGGMGAVYRAARVDGMFDKQVAIKLIRSGLSSDFFVSRFRNERQILASLEHPNIARLIDGGVSEEGLPYLVLEFVSGEPIDHYCARRDLAIADRLKLFRQVCSAVQYAHQNLVVHRDLKPGNILVTEDGVPKLLDFGIAKMLDPGEETSKDRTLTIIRIMTPDFASPEQVRGAPITTSSDVYSLGVILYVLLTGQRPYRVASSAPHELVKAVCDADPEKPSSAVTRCEKPSGAVKSDSDAKAAAVETDLHRKKLRRALSGDLDNIVLKALRKEPARRYATVEQLSEDVRRHLEHLPVSARKDTPGYLASKFIMRHKAGVAAGVAIGLTLVAALMITLYEARVAQRRFEDVRSLANSLIFDVHDSIKDLPGSTPARKLIVDRALQYLNALTQESGGDLALQRELATAYERVGLVQGHYLQNSLGDTQGSLVSYQKALRLRREIDAKSKSWEDRLALAQAYRLVANQEWALGGSADAVKHIAASVAISEALSAAHAKNLKILKELRSDYEMAGTSQANLYFAGTGDPGKQGESYRRAVVTDEAMLALSPDDFDVKHGYAVDLKNLGAMLTYREKDLSGALACFKKELQIDEDLRQHSTDTRYARGVAVGYSHVAQAFDRLGNTALSAENFTQGLEVSKQLVAADPKNTLFQQGLAIAYANTANELSKTGRYLQNLGYVEKSDQIMRALVVLAPENKQQRGLFAGILATNGITWGNLGKLDAAIHDLEEARASFELLDATGSPGHEISIHALTCTGKMGEAASRTGNSKLAAGYFHQVLKEVEPELAKQNPDPSVPYLAADSYSGLGDLEQKSAHQWSARSAQRRESWAQARAWYVKSLEAWRRIEHPLPVAPSGFDAGDPAKVAKNLRLCDTALAKATVIPAAR